MSETATQATTPRLKTKYKETIKAQLTEQFGYGNVMLVPGLTGDVREVADGTVDDLAVTSCLADTGVHDDLHKPGDLVNVGEPEVLGKLSHDLVAVLLLETRQDCLDGRFCFCCCN